MIDILLFAELQEAAGQEKVSIEAEGLDIAAIKEVMKKVYQLSAIDKAMVAVNEEYAEDSTVVNKGDTVAFIPPVSGG